MFADRLPPRAAGGSRGDDLVGPGDPGHGLPHPPVIINLGWSAAAAGDPPLLPPRLRRGDGGRQGALGQHDLGSGRGPTIDRPAILVSHPGRPLRRPLLLLGALLGGLLLQISHRLSDPR